MSRKNIIRKRSRSGLGLFTTRDIPRGRFILEYTGELISTDEANRRGGRYLFEINKQCMRDARNRFHLARYINHSCRPNCTVYIDERKKQIAIHAKRRILAGEELTYHYGKEYWEDFIGPKKCTCAKCD